MPDATVDALITSAEARLEAALTDASEFIDALKEQLDVTLSTDVPGRNRWNITGGGDFAASINATPTRPTGLNFAGVGSLGAAPSPTIRTPDFPIAPNITSASPDVNIPTAPTISIPSAPSEPSITPVTIPTAPVLDLPDTPVLGDVELPVTPVLVIPTFDQTFPVEPDMVFDGSFNYTEPEFVTDLLTQMDGRILDDLINGNTGLFNEEDALFSRARDRFANEGRTREQKAYVSASSRGFQLPTGILETMLDEAREETQNQVSEAARAILVERADLIRKTREFMLTQGIALTQLLITHFGFRQERVLKAQEFAAEFAKTVYDVSVARYKVQIEAFQAFTSSYGEQVRAVLGQVEIFRGQLEASRIRGEINEQSIRIYLAQHEAAKTLVALFNAQMGAAQIEADINRTRIQGFAERVRAFVSQIDAERTRLDVYETQIKGEAAKVEIYRTQVQADAIQVQGVATQARIEGMRQEASIESARLEFTAYAAQIEEFKARLDQEVARVRTLVDVYGSDIGAYSSNVSGWSSFYSMGQAAVESFLRQITEETKISQQQSLQEFNQLTTTAQFRASAAEQGVNLYKSLLAAGSASIQSIAAKEETA